MGSDYLFSLTVTKPPISATGYSASPLLSQEGQEKRERPYRYTEVKEFPSTLFFIQGIIDKAGDIQYTINALNTRFRGRRLLSTVQSRFLSEIHDGTAGHKSKPAARLPQGQWCTESCWYGPPFQLYHDWRLGELKDSWYWCTARQLPSKNTKLKSIPVS